MHQLSRAALRLDVERGYNATYVIHQLVADLFGERDDRGYLYRVLSRAPREAEVLVFSSAPPLSEPPSRDWGRVERVESRPYDFVPGQGQVIDFEIRLNATQVVTDERGRKARTDVWDAAFREDPETSLSPHDVYGSYLARRLGDTADVRSARVVERGLEKASRAGRRPIQFVSTNLIGTLQVDQPKPFLEIMAQGIGRTKAFGQGLLCLSNPGSVLTRRHDTSEMF